MDHEQIQKLDWLLSQSERGLHHLFKTSRLKEVLSTPTVDHEGSTIESSQKIQSLFGELLDQETFRQKQDFVKDLNGDEFEALARAYFRILSSCIQGNSLLKH